MQPTSSQDYKQLLTEVIKKQIVILGPDITLSKARNVKGLTVANDGTVTNVEGAPQEVTQALIDQFVQLSGLIVKKTMEPLLTMSQPTAQPMQNQVPPASPTPTTSTSQTVPVATPVQAPVVPEAQNAQAVINAAVGQPNPAPTESQSAVQQSAQPAPAQPVTEPAKNPLAA